jgi:hypothetical protein
MQEPDSTAAILRKMLELRNSAPAQGPTAADMSTSTDLKYNPVLEGVVARQALLAGQGEGVCLLEGNGLSSTPGSGSKSSALSATLHNRLCTAASVLPDGTPLHIAVAGKIFRPDDGNGQ